MIPKRIFYVWGVNDPKKRDVLACMQSWYQNCPEYEIIEINESSVKYFDFQRELETNLWFRTVYERKMWAYVADYIRIKVLYEHGGIYLDTDVTVLKNFDNFLKEPAFVGMQSSEMDGKQDHVEPAILGAQKCNPILKCILDVYDNDIWKLPIYTMPQLFAYAFEKIYGNKVQQFGSRGKQQIIKYPDITIYPEGVFIPFRYGEIFSQDCITDKTHTIHWWNASWVKPHIWWFLENKHKLSFKKATKLNKCPISFKRYCLPFTKTTIIRSEQYETEQRTVLMHTITLLSINKKWVKLFGILPIMSVKQG